MPSRAAPISGIWPSWNRSSGWKPELDLLDLVEHAAVGLQKREIGREIIADLGAPSSLGTIWA